MKLLYQMSWMRSFINDPVDRMETLWNEYYSLPACKQETGAVVHGAVKRPMPVFLHPTRDEKFLPLLNLRVQPQQTRILAVKFVFGRNWNFCKKWHKTDCFVQVRMK